MKLRTPIGLAGLARTPMGKVGGALAGWPAHELMGRVLAHVAEGTTAVVDEVVVGSVRNALGNVGRVAALDAGLDISTPASTVDRQCASSLEALHIAAAKVGAGLGKRFLVGGVESSSRAPWLLEKTSRPYSMEAPRPFQARLSTPEIGDPSMGETAEILADEFDIGREEMDEFALESHRRAARATEQGIFAREILTLPARGRQRRPVERDETIRPDTSLEALAGLPPAFREDGRVTAGNASPYSDGASGCMAAALDTLEADGIEPDAVLLGIDVVALDPRRMGMGPALSIPRLLEAHGLRQSDVDLFEINEAFAGQVLAVNRELEIPRDVLNVHGGAIALGHPFGATGVRLLVTLVNALRARDAHRGVASLCIGGGQGMAVLVELV